jgi:hypothetical protein
MKHLTIIFLTLLAVTWVATNATAMVETGGIVAPEKTLADFQRENAGTKLVVAWNKYAEYKSFPRPTLEAGRIRTEAMAPAKTAVADYAAGTKWVVGFWKSLEGEREAVKMPVRVIASDQGSGTKWIVRFLKG